MNLNMIQGERKCPKCDKPMKPIRCEYNKKRGFYYCAEYNCEICGCVATVNDYGGVDYYNKDGEKIIGCE